MVNSYDLTDRDVLLHKVPINPLLVSVHATRDSRFSLMSCFQAIEAAETGFFNTFETTAESQEAA